MNYAYSLVVGIAFAIVVWCISRYDRRMPHPPGPKPSFLVGNLADMPTESQWLAVHEWFQKYVSKIGFLVCIVLINSRTGSVTRVGCADCRPETLLGDLVYISVLGQPMVFVGSAKRAAEMFDKRSAIYSSRPRWPMVVELYVILHRSFRLWEALTRISRIGLSYSITSMPYGTRFRVLRWRLHEPYSL